MELEQTPFYEEYKKITSLGRRPVHYHWTMVLYAGDEKIIPMKLLSIATVRNFHNSYGDNIVASIMLPGGVYYNRIYPKRQELRAILYRAPLYEVGTEVDMSRDIEAQEMRAILMDINSAITEANANYTPSEADTNAVNMVTVKIGLVDPILEKVRMMTFDGVYRDTTTGDLIRHVLTAASEEISADEEIKIKGVDLYQPDNTEKKTNIVIPSGTRLTDVPYFLHENVAGVYNCGFGYFLHNPPPKLKSEDDEVVVEEQPKGKYWFVYPTLSLKRYEQSVKGLTIIRIPMERMQGVERTYRRTMNQLICLISDTANSADTSEIMQLNAGNGVRFGDANAIYDSFGSTKDNKTNITRKGNVNEYLIEERPTELNNVQFSDRRITTNTFAEASAMAARTGLHLTCNWDNSDPGSIWPGMPVKYMFMVGDQPYESYGVVRAAQHYVSLAGQGITAARHTTTTSLLLFLSKATPWADG